MAHVHGGLLKRAFDIALALALAVPAFVLVSIFGMLVRLESPGPAIFRQSRIGRERREFTIFKLRTMRAGTADLPSHVAGTSHMSRIGPFLRRFKLDELPQLLNVIRGDMSFVGPRPCLPSQSELIEERDRQGVFALRPGITGVAQVQGYDMSDPKRLAQVDAQYLSQWQLAGDLRLLVDTLIGKGNGDAATKNGSKQSS